MTDSSLSGGLGPGRGPFRAPPPEILRQLERTRLQSGGGQSETVVFDQADLSGLDLGGEWMADGIFYEANLSHARLDGAILRSAMAGGIVLRQASCCGTDFYKAGLQEADFGDVLGHGIYLGKADASGARFDGGSFWHGHFKEAACSRASFVGANLSQCDFRNASLDGADLRTAALGWADFSGAYLDSQTRLAGAKGVEDYVTATMIRFEDEEIVGNGARDLLLSLARDE